MSFEFLQAPARPTGLESSSRTLWIGDLPAHAEEGFLRSLFASSGALLTAKVIRNKATQASEGYGFLEFVSREAAQQVLDNLNGKQIPNSDQVFRLNWAAFGVGKMGEIESPDFSVFVGDLAAEVTDFLLQQHFAMYYPSVRSAKVITDPLTGRSKGYGFVRFGSEGERDRALGEMAGHFISSRPIRVSIATAKKNPTGVSAQALAQGIPHPSDFDPTNTTIFVGGLSGGVSEEDLRVVFSRFGAVTYVRIPLNKGCGFVQFVERPAAEAALVNLQGQIIGSNAIRLSWGRSNAGSRPSLPSAVGSYGPAAYPGAAAAAAAAYPGYGAAFPAGYGALPGAVADPYAAYAQALAQQASAAYPALYQAYQQTAVGPQAAQLAGTHPSLHGLLAAQQARPAQADPLAAPDVAQLNALYLQRNQASLLGALRPPPATTADSLT